MQKLFLTLAIISASCQTDMEPRHLDRLDGTWRITRLSETACDLFDNGTELTFSADVLRFKFDYGAGPEEEVKSVRLEATDQKIELRQHPTRKGWSRAGIFKLENDELVLSLDLLSHPATDFQEHKDGPSIIHLVRVGKSKMPR